MTFTMFWLVFVIASAILLSFSTWWNISRAKLDIHSRQEDRILTLSEFIIGLFFVFCPLVNFFVVIGCLFYIFTEIAPKIVLIGEKK
jgi:hypothetical protein